jgi:outer membrane protein
MDDIAIEYSRNQLLPALNINYTYNMNGLGGSRHDSYNMLFDNDYADHSARIYASIPLGNKSAKSRLNRAILTRTKQLSSMENKKAMIENEVLKGIDQMETTWQHILASRKSAMYAGTQYTAEKRQYELGSRTSNDVLTAQKDLTQAQVGEVIALAQYQIDLINLAYSTGTLLGEAKVDLGPFVPEN